MTYQSKEPAGATNTDRPVDDVLEDHFTTDAHRLRSGIRKRASELAPVPLTTIHKLPPEAQRYLRGLSTICHQVAETDDPRHVRIGLRLIEKAPFILAQLATAADRLKVSGGVR